MGDCYLRRFERLFLLLADKQHVTFGKRCRSHYPVLHFRRFSLFLLMVFGQTSQESEPMVAPEHEVDCDSWRVA